MKERSAFEPEAQRSVISILRDLRDNLIGLFDVLDGDPDLEPDADIEATGDEEPSLGSTDGDNQKHWAGGTADDREKEEA